MTPMTRIATFGATLSLSTLLLAQNPVSHQNFDADFYEGDGETAVLLVHGTLAHNRMEIIETLSLLVSEDYGFPVLAPNLSYEQPGRSGMLDCGLTHTHKDTAAASEIASWVNYLEDAGYARIVVAAHSRGGAQVSAYLADSPSPAVVGAVLIAPATYDADRAASGYQNRYGKPLAALIEEATAAPVEAVLEVPGFVYCENAKVTAASFLDYYVPRADRDTPTNLQKVSIPVAIVAGSADDVVADLPDALATAGVLNDQITLTVLEGADHFFRDLYADDVASVIVDVIEQTP